MLILKTETLYLEKELTNKHKNGSLTKNQCPLSQLNSKINHGVSRLKEEIEMLKYLQPMENGSKIGNSKMVIL